jgi:hypothetical protein
MTDWSKASGEYSILHLKPSTSIMIGMSNHGTDVSKAADGNSGFSKSGVSVGERRWIGSLSEPE